MNKPILAAALLSVLTLFVHVFAASPEYLTPALHSDMSPDQKTMYVALWFGVAIILAINTIALTIALKPDHRKPLVGLVSVQYLAYALLFIYLGITRAGSLWTQPQWTVFLLMAALAFWGAREKSASKPAQVTPIK